MTALVHRRAATGIDGAAPVRGDITDAAGLAAALGGRGPFDAVIHCAGRATDVGPEREFRRVNLLGVRNVVGAMASARIGRLVHISTTDVYGLRDFHGAYENTPYADNIRNPYAKYKILAERAVRQMLGAGRYVLLRPGIVWGPGDRTILPRVLRFLRSSPAIVHFGRWRGRNRWPLAHVRNVARAAYLAAAHDDALGRAINVLDPERTTIEQYYRLVLRACLPARAGMPSVTVPFLFGWAIGQASTLASAALGRDRPLFDPSLYGLYTVSCNLDFATARLQQLFVRHGQAFVDRQSGFEELGRTFCG